MVKRLCPLRSPDRPWRLILASVVIVNYLVLLGEAIHCQYFDHDHAAHHHSQAQAKDHKAHCATAGHCSAAAIQTATMTGLDPLRDAEQQEQPSPERVHFGFIASNSPRAPPAPPLTV